MPPEAQTALRDTTRILIAEKNWEGCGGLAMNDEVRVAIASQAALLLLGIEHDYYPRVQSILVYPGSFSDPRGHMTHFGVVDEDSANLGQAWYRGPVIFSWNEICANAGRPHTGHNVVLHEFSHKLDMEDHAIDGTPRLANRGQYKRWQEVMSAEFEELRRQARLGRRTLLDQYGASDEAEFFAVTTECFFMLPGKLKARHPHLYDLLSEFYGQQPADWLQPT